MQKNIYLYIFNSTYSPLQLDPGVVDGAPDPLKLTGASDNVAAATRGSHALTSRQKRYIYNFYTYKGTDIRLQIVCITKRE